MSSYRDFFPACAFPSGFTSPAGLIFPPFLMSSYYIFPAVVKNQLQRDLALECCSQPGCPVCSIPAPIYPGGILSCDEEFSWSELLQQGQELFLQEIQGKGISVVAADQVAAMFPAVTSVVMALVVRQKYYQK